MRDLNDGIAPDLLPARAMEWNELRCEVPRSEAEVMGRVKSAIRDHQEGRNWVGQVGGRVVLTATDFETFKDDPDALALWMQLRLAHEGRNDHFAISVKAMERDQVMPRWSARKYREVRRRLLLRDRLHQVHEGGSGPGDPHLYTLK